MTNHKSNLWNFTIDHGYCDFDTKDKAVKFGKLKKLWWDSTWDTTLKVWNPSINADGKWNVTTSVHKV